MKKICILTQSHLCRNPRVVKEANALHRAGYPVKILTTFSDMQQLREDKSLIEAGIELKGVSNIIPGHTSKLRNLFTRLRRRIAVELTARLGWEDPEALGYGFRKNLKAARKEQAGLYACHQEMATAIGYKLLKEGHRVAFDLEDWYSHDLLPEANKYRPLQLLEKYEKYALTHASLVYTTSESMAGRLARFAGTSAPGVLYNAFPLKEREWLDNKRLDKKDPDKVSVHWYSQTAGPGRGLEFLIRALDNVYTPVELHLRGNCRPDYEKQLHGLFPHEKGHELFIHPLVPHKELLSRIAEHDIGLALEEYAPDSRDLTITNKILQYILAGLAVVASDTSGQKEVARKAPESVFIFNRATPEELSTILNKLIEDKSMLAKAKEKSLTYAENIFCWEEQEKKLVKWIQGVMRDTR